MTRITLLAAAGAVCLSVCAAKGQDALYQLNPGSFYEHGCHGGCDCPILFNQPLTGTFRLTFTASEPDWFDHYSVSNIQWSCPARDVTGRGTFIIGGDFAYTNQMTLDLVMPDRARHVDSGLRVVQGPFPRIVITVDNSNESPLCYDTVIHIDASPIARYCSADIDGDGDIGTDADIQAFFGCLAGSCCALCVGADFNGDGDVGTDADIESFFRVLAGGAC